MSRWLCCGSYELKPTHSCEVSDKDPKLHVRVDDHVFNQRLRGLREMERMKQADQKPAELRHQFSHQDAVGMRPDVLRALVDKVCNGFIQNGYPDIHLQHKPDGGLVVVGKQLPMYDPPNKKAPKPPEIGFSPAQMQAFQEAFEDLQQEAVDWNGPGLLHVKGLAPKKIKKAAPQLPPPNPLKAKYAQVLEGMGL